MMDMAGKEDRRWDSQASCTQHSFSPTILLTIYCWSGEGDWGTNCKLSYKSGLVEVVSSQGPKEDIMDLPKFVLSPLQGCGNFVIGVRR